MIAAYAVRGDVKPDSEALDQFIADAKAAVCGDKTTQVATITTPWGTAACTPAESAETTAPRPDRVTPIDRSLFSRPIRRPIFR